MERNSNNLKIIYNGEKQTIHAMDMHYSYCVMTCTIKITFTSNTLKKLLLQYNLHSSYNRTKYNGEEEIIHNIFSTHVETLLNYVNHPAFLQEWKLNIDAPAYDFFYANVNRPSDKNKLIIIIAEHTGQSE